MRNFRKRALMAAIVALNVGLGLALVSSSAQAYVASNKACQWSTCGPSSNACQTCGGLATGCGTNACGANPNG